MDNVSACYRALKSPACKHVPSAESPACKYACLQVCLTAHFHVLQPRGCFKHRWRQHPATFLASYTPHYHQLPLTFLARYPSSQSVSEAAMNTRPHVTGLHTCPHKSTRRPTQVWRQSIKKSRGLQRVYKCKTNSQPPTDPPFQIASFKDPHTCSHMTSLPCNPSLHTFTLTSP